MLWAILVLTAVNFWMTLLLLRRVINTDNAAVIAAVKKARELILFAIANYRQQGAVGLDKIEWNTDNTNRIAVWLKQWAERLSK